jgi:hypothetical protein
MSIQINLASNRLYGEEGLQVSDVKLFPGAQRDISKDEFAEQLNKSLAEIENGDYELVDGDHH